MSHTVFVIGAGLGTECGFPDGPGLKKVIRQKISQHDRELNEIFKIYAAQTIDEIAGKFPTHRETLRRLVVETLFELENLSHIEAENASSTYKLLLNKISNAQDHGHTFSIITFNYDRSLQTLIQRFNTLPLTIIDPDIVIPVYGRLAPLYFEDSDRRPKHYHDYGKSPYRSAATVRNENDRFAMYERQSAMDDLVRASPITFISEAKVQATVPSLVAKADQVIFLGAGYHAPNMELLKLDMSKKAKTLITGTGLNLEEDQVSGLYQQFPGISQIVNCNALNFLRYKFDFLDPEKNKRTFKRPPTFRTSYS